MANVHAAATQPARPTAHSTAGFGTGATPLCAPCARAEVAMSSSFLPRSPLRRGLTSQARRPMRVAQRTRMRGGVADQVTPWAAGLLPCGPEAKVFARTSPALDGLALRPAGALLGRLDLAVLRRRGSHQLGEELLRGRRYGVDGALERRRVRRRRLREAADLADVLQGGGVDVRLRRLRLVVVERVDVSAHGREPTVSASGRGGRDSAFDRALELLRLEAEWALTALEDDPAVAADQVEPIGPAAVGRRDGVVDTVDDHRHPHAQVGRAGGRDSQTLLVRARLVHRKSGSAVLGEDPPLLGVRLADVDDQEVHPAAVRLRQRFERPDLGAERRSSVGAEDERDGPLRPERAEAFRGLGDLRRHQIAVVRTRHHVLERQRRVLWGEAVPNPRGDHPGDRPTPVDWAAARDGSHVPDDVSRAWHNLTLPGTGGAVE